MLLMLHFGNKFLSKNNVMGYRVKPLVYLAHIVGHLTDRFACWQAAQR
jgi:hypothetical protein